MMLLKSFSSLAIWTMEKWRNRNNTTSTMKSTQQENMSGPQHLTFTPKSKKLSLSKMRKINQLGNWRPSNKVTEMLKKWLMNFNSWSLKQDLTKTIRCWFALTDVPWTLSLPTRSCTPLTNLPHWKIQERMQLSRKDSTPLRHNMIRSTAKLKKPWRNDNQLEAYDMPRRATPTTTGNPDTTMYHDNNMTPMLWTSMWSWWLSTPCLMKNKAIICATGSASIASNLDTFLTNAERSDPQM